MPYSMNIKDMINKHSLKALNNFGEMMQLREKI